MLDSRRTCETFMQVLFSANEDDRSFAMASIVEVLLTIAITR